jgi:hypothetical protein
MGKRQRGRPELGTGWGEQAQAVFLGLRAWRTAHPRATLAEIETELDRQWLALRAQVLGDLALASRTTDLTAGTPEAEAERPVCAACGGPLHAAGAHPRTLQTLGHQAVPLTRDYAICPACGTGSFPPGRGTGSAAIPAGEPAD